MAQFVRTIVELVDDLDGTVGEETIEFGWDGKQLVIDLSAHNAQRFRKVIAPFVNSARPKPKQKRKSPTSKAVGTEAKPPKQEGKQERTLMREWGRANGFEVSNLSRIPRTVVDAYHQAHQNNSHGKE